MVVITLLRNVERESRNCLTNLETKGIISPIQFSPWAAPILPVVKRDGSVGICGDYKVTINPAIQVESYPLPRVDEIFTLTYQGENISQN